MQTTELVDLANPLEDIAAETAVLGSIIIDDRQLANLHPWLRASDFTHVRHSMMFAAALFLMKRGAPCDAVTLAGELSSHGQLEGVGGRAYLARVAAETPTSLHAAHYGRIVRGLSDKRALAGIGQQIAALAQGPDAPDIAYRRALDLLMNAHLYAPEQRVFSGPERARLNLDRYGRLAQAQSAALLPTGFRDLDRLIGGIPKGGVALIAARTSVGKSQIAWQIAAHNITAGRGVVFASTEMRADDIDDRELARLARVPIQVIVKGGFGHALLPAVSELVEWQDRSPRFIYMNPPVSLPEVAAILRQEATRSPVDLVVVDYLQQLQGSGDTEYERLTRLSAELKAMASTYQVAVLACAQLNREFKDRADRHPTLTDLRGSGALEQDADIVMLLHRWDYFTVDGLNPQNPHDAERLRRAQEHVLEVDVEKIRQGGRTGVVELQWVERNSRYEDRYMT